MNLNAVDNKIVKIPKQNDNVSNLSHDSFSKVHLPFTYTLDTRVASVTLQILFGKSPLSKQHVEHEKLFLVALNSKVCICYIMKQITHNVAPQVRLLTQVRMSILQFNVQLILMNIYFTDLGKTTLARIPSCSFARQDALSISLSSTIRKG